jgi:hypothetical protein
MTLPARLLARAGDVLLAILVIGSLLLLAGQPWNYPSGIAFLPMLGSVNCHYPLMSLMILSPVVVLGSRYIKKARFETAVLLALFTFFSSMWVFGTSWEILSNIQPVQRAERVVTITSIDQQSADEEPDCTVAYFFNDSVGNEQFVCTEDASPLQVGSKARVTEQKNFFGVVTLKFTPEPSATAGATPTGH